MAVEIAKRAREILLAGKLNKSSLDPLEINLLEKIVEDARIVELKIAPTKPASQDELHKLAEQIKQAAKAKPEYPGLHILTNAFGLGGFYKEIVLDPNKFSGESYYISTFRPRVKITAPSSLDKTSQISLDLRGITGASYVTSTPIIWEKNHPLSNAAVVVIETKDGTLTGQVGYRTDESGLKIVCPNMDSSTPYNVLVPLTSPQASAVMDILHPLHPAK